MADLSQEAAQLIAKQQLEIERLRKRCQQHEADKDNIHRMLVCIGGPLNSGREYSKGDMAMFGTIKRLCEQDGEEVGYG